MDPLNHYVSQWVETLAHLAYKPTPLNNPSSSLETCLGETKETLEKSQKSAEFLIHSWQGARQALVDLLRRPEFRDVEIEKEVLSQFEKLVAELPSDLPFQPLPLEIIQFILSFLPHHAVFPFSQVSSGARKCGFIFLHTEMWKDHTKPLSQRLPNKIAQASFFAYVEKTNQTFQKLYLDSASIKPSDYSRALFSQLKDLTLEMGTIQERPLIQEFSPLSQLKSLRITQGYVSATALSPLSHLRTLSLTHCILTPPILLAIGTLTLLQELDLSNPHSLRDVHQITLKDNTLTCLSHLTNLERLKLSHWRAIKGRFLEALSALTRLRELDFFNCSHLDFDALSFLKFFTRLETLSLRDDKRSIAFDYSILSCLKTLYALNLGTQEEVDESDLDKLKLCMTLTKLELLYGRFTKNGLCSLFKLTNLEDLDLSVAEWHTEEACQDMTSFQKLKRLSLRSCLNLKKDDLQIFTTLSSLEALDISACKQFSDDDIQPIMQLKTLRSLKMHENDKLSSAILERLSSLTALQALSLPFLFNGASQPDVPLNTLKALKISSDIGELAITMVFLSQMTTLRKLDVESDTLTIPLKTFKPLTQLSFLEKLKILLYKDKTVVDLTSSYAIQKWLSEL